MQLRDAGPVILLGTTGCFYIWPIKDREVPAPEEFTCDDVSCSIVAYMNGPELAGGCTNPTPEMQACIDGTGGCVFLLAGPTSIAGDTCCMYDESYDGSPVQDTEEYRCCFDDNDEPILDDEARDTYFDSTVNAFLASGGCFDVVVDQAIALTCDAGLPVTTPDEVGLWGDECAPDDALQPRIYNGDAALLMQATASYISLIAPNGESTVISIHGSAVISEPPIHVIQAYASSPGTNISIGGLDYSNPRVALTGQLTVAGDGGMLLVGVGKPWSMLITLDAGPDSIKQYELRSALAGKPGKIRVVRAPGEHGPQPPDTMGVIDYDAGTWSIDVHDESLGWETTIHLEGVVLLESQG